SGEPSSPPPTPGLLGSTKPGSCVPRGKPRGDPMSSPCPAIVLQFTPSARPMLAQSAGAIELKLTACPGKVKNFSAMLPAGANASNCGVSYHPEAVSVELFRMVS